MLTGKFGQAVSWCLSPEKMTATWQRIFENAFGDASKNSAADVRNREQLIHDQAKRAIEWNWGRPSAEIHAFIRQETPPRGHGGGVTADEIFAYSQAHYLELLPERVDAESQPELDALRVRLQNKLPSPAPLPT